MTQVPDGWKATDLTWRDVAASTQLEQVFGWTFFEHPTKGDEGHVLAISLDHIGPNGPIVYDTGEYEVPEYL